MSTRVTAARAVPKGRTGRRSLAQSAHRNWRTDGATPGEHAPRTSLIGDSSTIERRATWVGRRCTHRASVGVHTRKLLTSCSQASTYIHARLCDALAVDVAQQSLLCNGATLPPNAAVAAHGQWRRPSERPAGLGLGCRAVRPSSNHNAGLQATRVQDPCGRFGLGKDHMRSRQARHGRARARTSAAQQGRCASYSCGSRRIRRTECHSNSPECRGGAHARTRRTMAGHIQG